MHCYEQCGIIPYTTCTRTQSSGCTPHPQHVRPRSHTYRTLKETLTGDGDEKRDRRLSVRESENLPDTRRHNSPPYDGTQRRH